MLSEISLATEPMFSRDPEEIVREFQSQAKQGAPLALVLYPYGRTPRDKSPKRMIFSEEYSEVSISTSAEGRTEKVSFGMAVCKVAEAQLLMRRAVGFALAIQRLKQEKGFSSEDEAVLACSRWEHGYSWPDKDIPDQEKSHIETLANELLWLCRCGQKALEDQDVLSRAIQAPPGVSAWILNPPDELGIKWPPAPQGDSISSDTGLKEWLTVPPLEIVRALARGAQKEGCVTLVLNVSGNSIVGLDFRQDGSVIGFYDMGGCWKRDSWKENESGIADFLADEKLSLRRAVVRAASFRHLLSEHGLDKAALLIALAEHGFAQLEDVPQACRPIIQRTKDLHVEILWNGMCVLGIGWAPTRD
jgi:hypothetical protein